MQRRRSRTARAGVLALVLSVTAGLTLGGAAEAAKKNGKKGKSTANVTTVVNQVVPPATVGPPARNGILTSTALLGKKFKGRQIADVNATVQYGVSGPGSDLGDLSSVTLTAPNGATTFLIGANLLLGSTVGPLTLDDETPVFVSGQDPADSRTRTRCSRPTSGSPSRPSSLWR